jgi:hypothetical protein
MAVLRLVHGFAPSGKNNHIVQTYVLEVKREIKGSITIRQQVKEEVIL